MGPSQEMIARVAKKSPETVVWIGGLEKAIGKEGNKALKAHIEQLAGTGPKFVNIGPTGQGGAIFGSQREAQAAIFGSQREAQAAIFSANGSPFQGKTLELDVWV